jgi:hypothetical protein
MPTFKKVIDVDGSGWRNNRRGNQLGCKFFKYNACAIDGHKKRDEDIGLN